MRERPDSLITYLARDVPRNFETCSKTVNWRIINVSFLAFYFFSHSHLFKLDRSHETYVLRRESFSWIPLPPMATSLYLAKQPISRMVRFINYCFENQIIEQFLICLTNHPIICLFIVSPCLSVDQLLNQESNHSINHSINEPMYQSINQSINQSIKKTSQYTIHSFNASIKQPIN